VGGHQYPPGSPYFKFVEHIKYPSQISDKAILKDFRYHLFKSHSSLLCLQWIQIFFNPPLPTNTLEKKYPTPNKLKKQLCTSEISIQTPEVPQNYEWGNLNFMSSDCMHVGHRTTMAEGIWNPRFHRDVFRPPALVKKYSFLSALNNTTSVDAGNRAETELFKRKLWRNPVRRSWGFKNMWENAKPGSLCNATCT
jgi:hypothetical protein